MLKRLERFSVEGVEPLPPISGKDVAQSLAVGNRDCACSRDLDDVTVNRMYW